MQTVGILVGVFAKTSSARSALGCVCLFLLFCIQEMFLRGSQTASEGPSLEVICTVPVAEHVSNKPDELIEKLLRRGWCISGQGQR